MTPVEFETTIEGDEGEDIPILVRATIVPAEPDVGLMRPFVDELSAYYTDVQGRPTTLAPDALLPHGYLRDRALEQADADRLAALEFLKELRYDD